MPDVPGEEAAKLLDQAEDIINAVGPEVLAEVRKEDERRRAQAGPLVEAQALSRRAGPALPAGEARPAASP